MSNEEILEVLNKIIKDVLDDDSFEIGMETTASDHADWDSLAQINIIVAIEGQFKIKFSLNEMKQFANVGDVVRITKSKL